MRKFQIAVMAFAIIFISGGVFAEVEADYQAVSAQLENPLDPQHKPPHLIVIPHSDDFFFLNKKNPFALDKLPDPLFGKGILHEYFQPLYDAEQKMQNNGLAWNNYYTVWYQQAQHTRKDKPFNRPDYMFNGRLDLGFRWDLPEGFWGKAHVEGLMRQGTNYGWSNDTTLNNNVGSVAGINGGYSPIISLNILSWTQHLLDDRLLVTVGKLHPNQYLCLSSVANDETLQFTASAFDGNNMPFLGTYAPGAVIQVHPFENRDIYIHVLGLDTADGPSQGLGNMDMGRYGGSVELGWEPTFNGLKGAYKINGWYADMKSQDLGSGSGFAVYAEQEIIKHTTVFLQYGYGDPKATHADNFLTTGVGIFNPFNRAGEMFGAAFCWARDSQTKRDEKLVETFYRIQITDAVQFTPDLQILFDPAEDPSCNVNFIIGARVRVQF